MTRQISNSDSRQNYSGLWHFRTNILSSISASRGRRRLFGRLVRPVFRRHTRIERRKTKAAARGN